MALHENEEIMPITKQEESELRRVFKTLCNFHAKSMLSDEILRQEDSLRALKDISDKNVNKDKINELELRICSLYQQHETLENSHTSQKIMPIDVSQCLAKLGKKCNKREVAEMIWEVDENLDGSVGWNEFHRMFQRNINDKTGLEPSKLYNLVQFMMYDVGDNGLVSVDETMYILFKRHGRAGMEIKLKELFGEEMQETGIQGGQIDFSHYISAVNRAQLAKYYDSAAGKIHLGKFGKNRYVSNRKKKKSALESLSN